MASSSEPLDLIVTVVSAKHLKNVNWRNGDLKPYVVLHLDPDHRLTTRSDDSTKPVWNERITLPLTRSVHESVLSIDIFHSNSPDLAAKALVGSVRFPLARLFDSEGAMMVLEKIDSLELFRPSGRTQGKIRLKLEIKKRPIQPQNYHSTPQENRYYSPAPQRDYYRDFSPSPYPLTDHYYSRFYYPPPPPPPRAMYDRASNYSLPSVPSAPVDHNPPPPRFPNYAPPPLIVPPSAPVDAFPVNEVAPQPSGPPPSAPVDAFPVNESSRFSSYGVPGGPSAPVDYSPYDHRQLQKTMGGLSLEEERAVAAERSDSEFGARPSCSYAREYRREC
ncbi:Calcium-dependent lipid-binding [Hirschfeldia incana]|nr:Calcium-dependent lipid-binding [Hirschfeldia incana]